VSVIIILLIETTRVTNLSVLRKGGREMTKFEDMPQEEWDAMIENVNSIAAEMAQEKEVEPEPEPEPEIEEEEIELVPSYMGSAAKKAEPASVEVAKPAKKKNYYNRLPVSYKPEQIEMLREYTKTTGKAMRAWVWEAIEEKMFKEMAPESNVDALIDIAADVLSGIEDEPVEEQVELKTKERRSLWKKFTGKN
jgi:hypothetical protein